MNSYNKKMSYLNALPTIGVLRDSLALDKQVLKLEDGLAKDLASSCSVENSVLLMDSLDIDVSAVDTFEDMILKKESAWTEIKKVFTFKKGSENASGELSNVVVGTPFESTKFAKEILIGSYPYIVKNTNSGKIQYDDVLGNYSSYADKLAKFYKEYVTDDMFKCENIVSTGKLKRHGLGIDDKIDLLGNDKLSTLYKFNINKYKTTDKSLGLNVVEYRFIPIEVFDIITFYLIRYCVSGGVEYIYYTMESSKVKKELPAKPITINNDLVEKVRNINIGNKLNLPMPKSDLVFEGTPKANIAKFIETINSLLKNIDYDDKMLVINKLPVRHDYYTDYLSQHSLSVDKNNTLIKYLFNMLMSNHYDNVEQGHYGNYYLGLYDDWMIDALIEVLKDKAILK